jgi:hypothetical protein
MAGVDPVFDGPGTSCGILPPAELANEQGRCGRWSRARDRGEARWKRIEVEG